MSLALNVKDLLVHVNVSYFPLLKGLLTDSFFLDDDTLHVHETSHDITV